MRPLPQVLPETEDFWTGGRDGRLCVKRCPGVRAAVASRRDTVCAECPRPELESAEVSGRATVDRVHA